MHCEKNTTHGLIWIWVQNNRLGTINLPCETNDLSIIFIVAANLSMNFFLKFCHRKYFQVVFFHIKIK
jgi:hypothetical protein